MELNKKKSVLKYMLYAKLIKLAVMLVVFLFCNACTISYKFNGASIDYSKTRTISIVDFPNNAELVHPPLAQSFSEALRDKYSKQTRLQLLKTGGDMHIEGEIVGYDYVPIAISADSYAAQTRLTLTVNVRFTNQKNPEDDFEKKYSAYQTFDSNKMLTDVQDELIQLMIEDITDNIYNDTVAKW